jgi:hypothetical protein
LLSAQQIVDLTARHPLPAIYAIPEFVDAGGLMAYATNRLEIFRRAATYARRAADEGRSRSD